MKRFINKLSMVVIIMLVFLAGCATMESRWETTKASGTIQNYEWFLIDYPEGELANKARTRIKELKEILQRIRNIDLSVVAESFLTAFLTCDVGNPICQVDGFDSISAEKVPQLKQRIEEWLLPILKTALEKAGYNVVKTNQQYDVKLNATYSEWYERDHASYKRSFFVSPFLQLSLTHPKYGYIYDTTLSGLKVSNPFFLKRQGFEYRVLTWEGVSVAPSEEIKNFILEELSYKLPFE